jgi:preprotein translocase subunit SecB
MDTRKVEAKFQFIGSSINKVEFDNELISFDSESIRRVIDVDYVFPDDIVFKEDGALGEIQMHVKIWFKQGNKTKTKLLVVASGYYKYFNCSDEDEMKKMLSISGCASLYSVIRAFVMSFTAQSGFKGSIILPMINIFRLNEEKQALIEKNRSKSPPPEQISKV